MARVLSPDPRDRPQTAAEFRRALEAESEALTPRVGQRHLADLMQRMFQGDRVQEHLVVSKQLERLTRVSAPVPPGLPDSSPGPSTVTTPASGWNVPAASGSVPDLGAGRLVHEAVTAVHTGLSPLASPGAGPVTSGALTAATAASLAGGSRGAPSGLVWVTLASVGIAGLMVGLAQPWRHLLPPPRGATVAPAGQAEGQAPVVSPPGNPAAAAVSAEARACDSPNKPLVELTGEITGDAELSCESDYLLRFTTTVMPGASLRIPKGTTLLGDVQTKATLVVQPGARIEAAGTAEQPIVFTSAAPVHARRPGDWGGVIVLGEAPTNLRSADGTPAMGRVEGIVRGGAYGGSNAEDSSGTLSYVRIEYSGTELAPNNEINGLTLAGVGRGTVLHHIAVRHTADDCFEFFGGTVDGKYLVCQAPGDDAFDWDYGYTGRLQFLVGVFGPEANGGSNGFEGDNDPSGSTNAPVSSPLIYNTTLCGKHRRMEANEHFAILLRRGTSARIRNGLFVGFSAGLDVRDRETRANIMASTFYNNLDANLAFLESRVAPARERMLTDDDDGFDELAYLTSRGVKIGEYDPRIGRCTDQRSPGLKPQYPLQDNAALPPGDGFFDPNAVYVGAFRDMKDDWDRGAWVSWGL